MVTSVILMVVFGFLVEVLRKAEAEVSSGNLSLACTLGKWAASLFASFGVIAFVWNILEFIGFFSKV